MNNSGQKIDFSCLTKNLQSSLENRRYHDKIFQCMTSTQELVGIHNDTAHKSWSKYTTHNKVGYQCMTSTQELVGIHNDTVHKSWSKYTTDTKVGKAN